ncbi:WD40 repeat-like protein [Imleria badia]|nr:WD40 repeat-like protein [Imleria badia]
MSSVIPENDGPQPQLRIWGHDSDIIALAYLPDGRRVVSGSHDKTVKVWNLEHGEQEGTSMEHEYEVDSLAVTRDGTKIISGDVGGIIKVWDVQSHELVREWTHEGGSPNVAISPDDRFIAVGGCNVGIYTLEGSQVNHSIELDETVWSISFSPDGKKLACGTDNDLRVYDIDTGTLVLRPLDGQGGRIYSVLWSRGGRRLFSASYDKAIRCWDADTVEQIGQPRIGHTDCTHAITLSPDGSILASASWDNTVRFWYATSGRPFGQHLRHDEEVEAVCFSPSGEFVASGSRSTPGSLYLWRVPWLNSIKDSAGSIVHNLSLPTGDITPSVLPHFYPFSDSLPTVEGQSKVSTLAIEFPPPPNLTPDIIRIKNQYAAGGSFGDVYRCRYHGSLVPIEVAVKAFRFSFIPEEDAGDKSIKMLRRELGIWRRLEHNNIVPFLGIAYGFGMDGTMSLVSLWMPNESLQKFLAKYDNHLNVVHRLRLVCLHYFLCFPFSNLQR